MAQHVNNGKMTSMAANTATKFEVLGGKTAREVAEQRAINEIGGISELANKVNPIGGRPQLLDDVGLGRVTKDNLVNWPGVIAADFGVDSLMESRQAFGADSVTTDTPYSGIKSGGIRLGK